ncbi:T9SS type A sorting domain-containing protein [Bacteroidota bacterium]
MKKSILYFFLFSLSVSIGYAQPERYLDEIFTEVDITTNVKYASNYNFVNPTTAPTPNFGLNADVYQPKGDAETDRACVIVLHTGNFLPKYVNQSTVGSNKDSAVVVSAELFAKRGYVAFTPSYRLGWDPTNGNPDVKRGTLLNAVYRSLNDVKALVRFIKKSVDKDGNPYGINPTRIIIYGLGSGGYLALAYSSLDRIEELELESSGKWVSSTSYTAPNISFTENQLYIDPAIVGGVNGFGGTYNQSNNPGYSNDVVACINAGGALGDSTWIEPGEPPIISFHCPDDDYAPFIQGNVIVPTTNEVVVDVVGSRWAIERANKLGNNSFIGGPYTDAYSLAAKAALTSSHPKLGLDPSKYEGLFPFIRPIISNKFQESGPWDWWDNVAGLNEAKFILSIIYPNDPNTDDLAQAIFDDDNAGSPTMSSSQGRAYLDSIQGYLAPRLHHLIYSNVGITETEADFLDANTFVYPNPARDFVVVKTREGIQINDVEIYNVTGARVLAESNLGKLSHQINVDQMSPGLYLVKVTTDAGLITRKVYVN